TGSAEEDDHECRPDERQSPPREDAFRRAAIVPNPPRTEREYDEPRQAAGKGNRNEVIPGSRALVLFRQESLQVLVDEEERQELVVRARHRDEPRRHDDEKEHGSRYDMQPPPKREVAIDERVDDERARGQ